MTDEPNCTEAEHGAHTACPHVWEWLAAERTRVERLGVALQVLVDTLAREGYELDALDAARAALLER